jgi:hypothetical protein
VSSFLTGFPERAVAEAFGVKNHFLLPANVVDGNLEVALMGGGFILFGKVAVSVKLSRWLSAGRQLLRQSLPASSRLLTPPPGFLSVPRPIRWRSGTFNRYVIGE